MVQIRAFRAFMANGGKNFKEKEFDETLMGV